MKYRLIGHRLAFRHFLAATSERRSKLITGAGHEAGDDRRARRMLKHLAALRADEILVMPLNTQAETNGCRNPADKLPVCNVKVQAGRQLITAAPAPAPRVTSFMRCVLTTLNADSCRAGDAGERLRLREDQRGTF